MSLLKPKYFKYVLATIYNKGCHVILADSKYAGPLWNGQTIVDCLGAVGEASCRWLPVMIDMVTDMLL